MEFKELSSISASLDCYIPFGLSRVESCNIFCALSLTKAQILELSYQHHHEGNTRFIQTSASCPKHIPSQDIEKNYNVIYDRADRLQQNQLQLDPTLLPEILTQDDLTFALVSAKFAPPLLNRKGLHLACLSNYGGCEIIFKNFTERTWNPVCFLSNMWSAHHLSKYPKKIETYENLSKYVVETHLTALSWNSDTSEDELQLCVISASGTVAFIQLEINVEQNNLSTSIQFEKEIGLRKVNLFELITFVDKQMKKHSFLVAGDLTGNTVLYRVCFDSRGTINDLLEVAYLWNANDRIRADGFKWSFDMQTGAFVVLYCKGSHVFCHLLTIAGKPVSHSIHYINGLFITAIHQLTNTSYLIGTLDGHITHITLEVMNKKINVNETVIKNDLNSSKYALYGLAGSTNNAFQISALFIREPYDHLKYRDPATLSIQYQSNENPLEKLRQNKINKLTFKQDYAEILRCIQNQQDIFEYYFLFVPSPAAFSDEYLYKLKIRLIATSARSTYMKQRGQMTAYNELLTEFDIVKKLLLTIRYCRGIQYLSSLTSLTDFQALSLQCQRNYVTMFMSDDLTPSYEQLRLGMQADIEVSLAESEPNERQQQEKCTYCDANIETGKLMCNDEHDMPRCCLSMVQVSLMERRGCIQCELITFDDLTCLEPLFATPNNEIMCPLCDSAFTDCEWLYS